MVAWRPPCAAPSAPDRVVRPPGRTASVQTEPAALRATTSLPGQGLSHGRPPGPPLLHREPRGGAWRAGGQGEGEAGGLLEGLGGFGDLVGLVLGLAEGDPESDGEPEGEPDIEALGEDDVGVGDAVAAIRLS